MRDEQFAMWQNIVQEGVDSGEFRPTNTRLAGEMLFEVCGLIFLAQF